MTALSFLSVLSVLSVLSASSSFAASPAVSTGTPTVESFYSAGALRDPFSAGAVSYEGRGRAWTWADFSLDALSLSGVLGDSKSRYALLTDKRFAKGFIFRWGRLYDLKGKAVPGVTGAFKSWEGKKGLRGVQVILRWQGIFKTYGLAKKQGGVDP